MFTQYFLSCHLLLAVGYLLYKLMGHDTFFGVRRAFLIGITLFALVAAPLAPGREVASLSAPMEVTQAAIHTLFAADDVSPQPALLSADTLFWWVYGGVAAFLCLRLLSSIFRLRGLLRRSTPRMSSGISYRLLDADGEGAFSFFGYIFIGKTLEPSRDLLYILRHEQAHVRGLHSLDMIWMQVMRALFWLNPFVPLLIRELQLVHEYLADRSAQPAFSDAKGYQLALLHHTSTSAAALLNNFNVSSLKKRIAMLNRKPTSKLWAFKYVVLIPAAFAVTTCFSWAKTTVRPTVQTMLTAPSDDRGAVYPGGETALMRDLADKLCFPVKALEDKVDGKCIVTFTINTDGSVGNARVTKSLTPECDRESLRVVGLLKRFRPAMKNGAPVAVDYVLPIRFRSK